MMTYNFLKLKKKNICWIVKHMCNSWHRSNGIKTLFASVHPLTIQTSFWNKVPWGKLEGVSFLLSVFQGSYVPEALCSHSYFCEFYVPGSCFSRVLCFLDSAKKTCSYCLMFLASIFCSHTSTILLCSVQNPNSNPGNTWTGGHRPCGL